MQHGPDLILLIGDSLTQRGFDPEFNGWAANLQNRFIRKAEVVNRGLSGYNSKWVSQIIDKLVITPRETLLTIIFVGVNDSVLPSNPYQHVGIVEYEINLVKIIESSSKKGKVLVICPTPCDVDGWEAHRGKSNERSSASTKLYHDACENVCRRSGYIYVSTWDAFNQCQDAFIDGVHFSRNGNTLMFNLVMDAILKNWPQLDPEKMQSFLPWWDKIVEPVTL